VGLLSRKSIESTMTTKAVPSDTAGEFGERYGTGSDSDLVDSEVVSYNAPGRYRSLYRTNSPAVSQAPALQRLPPILISKLNAAGIKAVLHAFVKRMRMMRAPYASADFSSLTCRARAIRVTAGALSGSTSEGELQGQLNTPRIIRLCRGSDCPEGGVGRPSNRSGEEHVIERVQ